MSKRVGNIYEIFEETESDGPVSLRKAQKKLREINVLKQKPNKSKEEIDKVNLESFWKNIVCPEKNIVSPHVNLVQPKKKQTKKQQSNEKRENDLKWIEEERQRNESQRIEEETVRRRVEEEVRRRVEKTRRRIEEEDKQKRTKMEEINHEFLEMVAQHKNVNKVFRLLSLKYHPDKNPADREHAEKIQKILGEIREQYVQ